MADETKWILPRDGNVPHPYNSKLRIKKEGEEMRVCGQVRRLTRRKQVQVLDAKPEAEKKPSKKKDSDSTDSGDADKKPVTKKAVGKKAGHQPKDKSTES